MYLHHGRSLLGIDPTPSQLHLYDTVEHRDRRSDRMFCTTALHQWILKEDLERELSSPDLTSKPEKQRFFLTHE